MGCGRKAVCRAIMMRKQIDNEMDRVSKLRSAMQGFQEPEPARNCQRDSASLRIMDVMARHRLKGRGDTVCPVHAMVKQSSRSPGRTSARAGCFSTKLVLTHRASHSSNVSTSFVATDSEWICARMVGGKKVLGQARQVRRSETPCVPIPIGRRRDR